MAGTRRKAAAGAPPEEPDVIWLGIKADEHNRNLIATLLLFANYPGAEKLKARLAADRAADRSPMEPDAFDLTAVEDEEPPLSADEARVEIGALMRRYIEKVGPEQGRRLFRDHGVTMFSELPESQYAAVIADLRRSLAEPPKRKS
jgi:hypothetical protein